MFGHSQSLPKEDGLLYKEGLMAKKSNINIGIPEKSRKAIADGLCRLLADSYTLYLKTHSFHWNVTGPQFNSLHQMFMTQYTEIWTAIDDVAERIRSLGFYAPGSYAAFSSLTSIKESTKVPKANQMVQELIEGHEAVTRTARSIFPLAEQGEDEASLDLLTQRIQIHEKTAWMLRSVIEK